MSKMITIVICYVRGTHEMMRASISSIKKHTKVDRYNIIIASQEGNLDDGLFNIVSGSDLPIEVMEIPDRFISTGREHGCILDKAMESVTAEYVVTMDSDAIPIKDGWLTYLLELIENDDTICTAGILHPWLPPAQDMKKTLMEWRVRSQRCYETTHVACQLIRLKDIKKLKSQGIGYASGDDTGLGMVKALKEQGGHCEGYKPTRCPKPEVDFDAEFNRYECVVFGDAVIHVGGHTRTTVDGDDAVFGKAFGWASDRILEDGTAEFILDDDNSYFYKFDKEYEVSQENMQRMFGLQDQRMIVE
jgi:hypothetical protein